jgi:multiple sugar transport system permease protein
MSVATTMAPTRRRSTERVKSTLGRVLLYAVLLVLAVAFMAPFLWSVSTSLKSTAEIYTFPPTLFPAVPQWGNYARVLEQVPYGTWVRNSVVIVVLYTVGSVLTASLVAYSFARFDYPFKNAIFLVTLGTMMLPSQVTLIPQYVLFHRLGWINTSLPLWVPAWFGGGAFSIFLLRQFLLTLPRELDEAAHIDGAGTFRIYWAILMPLCKPALATLTVFSIIDNWTDFQGPLIYLNTPINFTVAVGLNFFQAQTDIKYPMEFLLMAGSVMTIVPMVALFFLTQRFFMEGIVLSGVKH